jgi:hypothetical protein
VFRSFRNVALPIREKRRDPVTMKDADREGESPNNRLNEARGGEVENGVNASVDRMELLARVRIVRGGARRWESSVGGKRIGC